MSFQFFMCQKTLSSLDLVDRKPAFFQFPLPSRRLWKVLIYAAKYRRKPWCSIRNHDIWTFHLFTSTYGLELFHIYRLQNLPKVLIFNKYGFRDNFLKYRRDFRVQALEGLLIQLLTHLTCIFILSYSGEQKIVTRWVCTLS